MIFAQNLMMYLPVFFYVMLTGMLLLWLRRKNSFSNSAKSGCKTSRIVETLILVCAAVPASVIAAHLTRRYDNILLNLSSFQPAYARTHLILAGIICSILLVSIIFCIFGRTSLAVIIATVILMGYGTLMSRTGYTKTPYFMTLISPKDSWQPVINYTFEMEEDPNKQADLWLDDVHLGKMPLTISGWELYKKTPPLDEKTERKLRSFALGPEKKLCEIRLQVLKSKDNQDGHYWFTHGVEGHFAKVKIADELYGSYGYGNCQALSHGPRYDYKVQIPLSIEARHAKPDIQQMLDNSLNRARKNNYKVDEKWKSDLDKQGEYGWRGLRNAALKEKGFEVLVDNWVKDEYRIGTDSAQQIFERICKQADADEHYHTGFRQGRAIEMIFDKLDYEPIIADFKKAVKSKSQLRYSMGPREMFGKTYTEYTHGKIPGLNNVVQPASISVKRHVLQLLDSKFDAENPGIDNPVEKVITPAILIYRYDLDLAKEFGGSVYENYLLRQYRIHRRIEGIDMGHENYMYENGMHLNKWLYHLVHLDTPAGRKFRNYNSTATRKIAALLTTSMFNHSKHPPEFVFYDLDLGRNSLAVRFWKEYLIAVEDSSPGWEYDKFEKRLKYLLRLGEHATDDMYRQCWQYVNFKSMMGSNRIIKPLDLLTPSRKRFMAKLMLDTIEGNEKVPNNVVLSRQLKDILQKESK